MFVFDSEKGNFRLIPAEAEPYWAPRFGVNNDGDTYVLATHDKEWEIILDPLGGMRLTHWMQDDDGWHAEGIATPNMPKLLGLLLSAYARACGYYDSKAWPAS